MSSRRDDLFPAGSIGRAQGSLIQRIPSPTPSLTREVLTAHPLLSPTPSSASGNAAAPTSDTPDASPPGTRYATYTPRHRTAPTTGTTLQSSLPVSPPQQPGGSAAANKLQLMNLKAGAQSIGLETSSVGWEILEKLVSEHDSNPEWTDVWNALLTGKVPIVTHFLEVPLSYNFISRERCYCLSRVRGIPILRPILRRITLPFARVPAETPFR